MELHESLKVKDTLPELDSILSLMNSLEEPLFINKSYQFTDSICEHDVMEIRTDIFAEYESFESFEQLLYPKVDVDKLITGKVMNKILEEDKSKISHNYL